MQCTKPRTGCTNRITLEGGGRPVRANQNALIFLSSRRIGLIWIFRDGRVRRARGRGKARHFVAGGVAAKYVAEDTLAPPHEQERSSRDPFHAPYGVERDRVTDIGGKVLQLLSPLLPLLRCCSVGEGAKRRRSPNSPTLCKIAMSSPCAKRARVRSYGSVGYRTVAGQRTHIGAPLGAISRLDMGF